MLLTIALMLLLVNGDDETSVKPVVKIVKGKKVCQKGWECKRFSKFCCNETISDYFQTYQFENLFAKRNTPVAHAVGFWDYHSFITATAEHQPDGFGTTGGKKMGMKEVAAFLGHVGSKTSCELKILCFVIWFCLIGFINGVLRTYFHLGSDSNGFKWIRGFSFIWI